MLGNARSQSPDQSQHLGAPDIREAIIDGRQPKRMQLQELTKGMPSSWEEQKKLVHFD